MDTLWSGSVVGGRLKGRGMGPMVTTTRLGSEWSTAATGALRRTSNVGAGAWGKDVATRMLREGENIGGKWSEKWNKEYKV